MAVMSEEIPAQDAVLAEFLAMELSENLRAELIDGEIVVSPPPLGNHERIISDITRQIHTSAAGPMDVSGNKGLRLPADTGLPSHHVIPDLVVAPEALDLFHHADSWMPADGVAMVVEVTSSRPELDRVAKRRAYARAGIPLFLLVDRTDGTISLFSEPRGEFYTEIPRKFGDPVVLPPPFAFTLDTGRFA